MENFPYSTETSVRFRDTDAMGIAHHAVILSYLEEARTAYLVEALDLDGLEEISFTIARVECDYRAPATYGDRLKTGVRVTDIGDRSFEMAYRVEQAHSGEPVAEAKTVQVQYDYESGTSAPLPEDFGRRLAGMDACGSDEGTDQTSKDTETS
jgi:acyl-CoA thioester hydrolase